MNPNDPQLTAYALGELEPHERAAVEAALNENPECRRAVEEIREAAGALINELASEPCPELTSRQRETIESRLEPEKIVRPAPWFWRPAWGIAAMAACVAGVLAWQFWFAPAKTNGKQMTLASRSAADTAKTPLTPALSPGRGSGNAAVQAVPQATTVKPVAQNPGQAPVAITPVSQRPAPAMDPKFTSPAPMADPKIVVQAPVVDQKSLVVPPTGNTTAANEGVVTLSAPPAPADDVSVMARLREQRAREMAANGIYDSQKKEVVSAGPPPPPPPISMTADPLLQGLDQRNKDYFAAHPNDWTGQSAPSPAPAPGPGPTSAEASRSFSTSYAMGNATTTTAGTAANDPLQQRQQPIYQDAFKSGPGSGTTSSGSGGGGFGAGGRAGGGSGFGGGRAGNGVLPQEQTTAQNPVSIGAPVSPAVGGFGGGRRGGGFYRSIQPSAVAGETTVIYAENAPLPDFGEVRYYRYPNPPTIESYPNYGENSFLPVMRQPLSTFSVDVDNGSYANVRRFLNANQMPPADAVRLEEMVNYFQYPSYAKPRDGDPFAATIEVAGCPWNTDHRLVRVGLKGREIASNKRPPSNFVLLIDVSGSMATPERLPLIKQALKSLVMKMNDSDRVAIVVYAADVGVRLASTPCTDKEKILAVIDSLQAGGSTNGGDGIQQAYRVAQENFIEGGVNRVLLATDGDFNVGITDQNQLVNMIKERAKNGVALTTLGVGTDNYKDALMQKLADSGHGNYYYLDTLEEAQKVLIEQMSGTLVTIAKDVKIQIEFNPAQVAAYRLIGYEKRKLTTQDFNNDAKSAGDIGAGHTVTALYEVVPAANADDPALGSLRYQQKDRPELQRVVNRYSKELLTLKLRYKQPDGDKSRLLEFPITDSGASYGRASADFKFASAVAAFGMILRDSPNRGSANYSGVIELAREAKGADENGYRAEFITLVQKAQALSRGR